MKKVPATKFEEVKDNGKISNKGQMRLRFSQATTAYLSQHGSVTCLGTGTDFEIKDATQEKYEVTWEKVSGLRVFLFSPPKVFHKNTTGEVYTNLDRKPHESGMVLEVRKAMREQAIQHHLQRKEMSEHARKLQQSLRTGAPKPDPIPPKTDPEEPKPVAEPVDNPS